MDNNTAGIDPDLYRLINSKGLPETLTESGLGPTNQSIVLIKRVINMKHCW